MDFDSIIYHGGAFPSPERGDLLIADPLLQEKYFMRSVIMLLDVDFSDGYLGLILNLESSLTMRDLMPDWEGGKQIPLFVGGPVDKSRLFILHRLPEVFPLSMQIAPGIYLGANLEEIVDYINDGGETEGFIRFFLGYSGWSVNQLESELLNNVWALKRNANSVDLLRSEGVAYWSDKVRQLGKEYANWLNVPLNPLLN